MITIPQRILGEALQRTATKFSSKTAIIVKDREYAYNQLLKEATHLAGYLTSRGIRKGDKVAVYMDNSWQCAVSIYGITISGGVFLVINPQTKADKLRYILNDSESKIIISSSSQKNELFKALDGALSIEEVIISGNADSGLNFLKTQITPFDSCVDNTLTNVNFPRIIPSDLAALIYTSGSTGFPKGVMMTHQSMVFTCWSLIEYLRLTEDERIMLVLQLAFDYGLYQLLMSVTIGGTLIMEQSFTFTATIYKNIEKYRPTVFPGVPTIYAMMIASHKKNGITFESIRKITNTAALLPAEEIPDLKNLFPNALIFKMYGLTECKRVCYLEPELIDQKPDSVGKAIPGTEVFILSTEGKPVKPGEPGILYIRGPHVMLGYLNQEDLSAEMLKEGKLPGEKVLCSNDWFKMDEDGFLYFLGRNDDIIKTRGEKVSPVEIENIIYKINGVKEAAVIGIPDPIMGDAIAAFLTLHDSVSLTEKEVQQYCMTYLEPFMIPQRVIFLEEMPKNSNGKIDKKNLKTSKIETTVKN